MRKTLKTCANGHRFEKSSDCPTCPVCEQLRAPTDGFLAHLGAPARRALENEGIRTLQQLARYAEKEILALHGMGPGTLPKLRAMLKAEHLSFRS